MAEGRAERLELARALAGAEHLDVSAALALLNTVPEAADAAIREAVDHARRAVAAAPGGDYRDQAIARYMIARVVAALEKAERDAAARGG